MDSLQPERESDSGNAVSGPGPIESWIAEFRGELASRGYSRRETADISAEAEDHLRERAAALALGGSNEPEAGAVVRYGTPAATARAFSRERSSAAHRAIGIMARAVSVPIVAVCGLHIWFLTADDHVGGAIMVACLALAVAVAVMALVSWTSIGTKRGRLVHALAAGLLLVGGAGLGCVSILNALFGLDPEGWVLVLMAGPWMLLGGLMALRLLRNPLGPVFS